MSSLLRLLSFQKPYRVQTILMYTCLGVTTALGLIVPVVIKGVLDRGLADRDMRFLVLSAVAILIIALLNAVFSFGLQYLREWISQRVAYDIRNQLYDHVQRLSFAYHDTAQTGQFMSRATSDVDAIRAFTGPGLADLTGSAVIFIGVTIILFAVDAQLAILTMIPTVLIGVIALRFGRTIRPVHLRIQQAFSRMSTTLQENLSGVRVVKAFAREPHEVSKYSDDNVKLLAENMRSARMASFYFPMMRFLTAVSTVILLWFGGQAVVSGRLTVGTVVAFNSYLVMLGWPLRRLGWVVNLMARASASGERVFEILDSKSPVTEKIGAASLGRLEGRVRFEHVTFSYGGKPVLREVDIDAQSGQIVALLGLTGSGKTTVVNLIPRFYDVNMGRITVDGHDVRDVTLASLRRQIGVVLQESFLFSASVRDNIAYGRPDASLDDVVAAAKAAHAHEFISDLPYGYDTRVGERGITLSGGQKQRVAIARALLMDPRILILDDSTSSVDTETEHLIQQALNRLMEGRTTFVIAQRLSTILRADQILVMKDGQIIQRGRHHELLAQGGLYQIIYELQLADQERARQQLARSTHQAQQQAFDE
jgi:ATP-binding cassette, subfamily B, multidrug efflux pump